MLSFLTVATTVWGLVMALAPILQIRLMIRTKDSSSVSLVWMIILVIGYLLWFSYGIASGSAPLIIANTVSSIVGTVMLIVILRYRENPQTLARQRVQKVLAEDEAA
ncbi:SemiSWEET family sugar transporter [Flaviflexus equikiangi]|uniref:SemiSWEET family sugar transporter n=1 Tax=Flaviflexus equikiangi TaxID=2758573 RepID=UPI0015F7065F|nr:SemiSWEET family transporter [Flaviflexus equikiangi]